MKAIETAIGAALADAVAPWPFRMIGQPWPAGVLADADDGPIGADGAPVPSVEVESILGTPMESLQHTVTTGVVYVYLVVPTDTDIAALGAKSSAVVEVLSAQRLWAGHRLKDLETRVDDGAVVMSDPARMARLVTGAFDLFKSR